MCTYVNLEQHKLSPNRLIAVGGITGDNNDRSQVIIWSLSEQTSSDACAMITVSGSFRFKRSSSLGIMTSFKEHSRSPLWWPKAPHLAHLTFRISMANGFTRPVTPVSSLQGKIAWSKREAQPKHDLRKIWPKRLSELCNDVILWQL
jgi:hypothetical protein